jgi:chlorobactene lauroyltransferase
MIPAKKNRLFEDLFLRYTRASLRRHFNSVQVAGLEGFIRLDRTLPMILYCNHSSWWDGQLAFFLSKSVLHINAYAMMEEKQMALYKFFRRIGAFSVVRESPREAVQSIRYAASLFRTPDTALWIYPQGVLLPNDTRPLRFFHGISRVAQRVGRVHLIPVAHRYEFLLEQRPESFTVFGEPMTVERVDDPKGFTSLLESRLTELLDRLRCTMLEKRLTGFTTVLRGTSSMNTLYDTVRSGRTTL